MTQLLQTLVNHLFRGMKTFLKQVILFNLDARTRLGAFCYNFICFFNKACTLEFHRIVQES